MDLSKYPRAEEYLARHRDVLERRNYVLEAGRKWYEIWVPQDPASWDRPKLVFRDIADRPTFWIDLEGSVVNGDCYWLAPSHPEDSELLWLAAAVGNSKFAAAFYDHEFHNKLYAGRRRFMTQYVEQFPLPDARSHLGQTLVAKAKEIHNAAPSPKVDRLEHELDMIVCDAFGLSIKEV